MRETLGSKTARNKGAPGLESRTGRRLVSPATGGEKKKWNPLYFGLKMQIRLHLGHLRVLVGQYSAILHEKLLWGLIEAKKNQIEEDDYKFGAVFRFTTSHYQCVSLKLTICPLKERELDRLRSWMVASVWECAQFFKLNVSRGGLGLGLGQAASVKLSGWVEYFIAIIWLLAMFLNFFLLSIIRNTLQMIQFQKIGFVRLVKHRGKDEEASAHADNYLITIFRYVPDYVS